MAVFIQLIVGELELVEGDDLFHPLSALGRGVWVHVDPGRGVWVRFARHHPAAGVECVPGETSDDIGHRMTLTTHLYRLSSTGTKSMTSM